MRKTIIIAASLAALVVPNAALANAPDGDWNLNDNGASVNASSIGEQSSAIKQNGQFVGNGDNKYEIDQTTTPGSRADLVQAALGH